MNGGEGLPQGLQTPQATEQAVSMVLHRAGPSLDPVWRSKLTAFVTKDDTKAFLTAEHRQIALGEWTEPKADRRAEDSLAFGPFAWHGSPIVTSTRDR